MRTCQEYQTLISAYIDGDLTGEEKACLMDHLASCPACKDRFDDMLAIHESMTQLTARAPEGFKESVMEKLEAGEAKRKVITFPQRFIALAACFLMVMTGVWMFGGLGGSRAPVEADLQQPAQRAATFAMEDAGESMTLRVVELCREGFRAESAEGNGIILVQCTGETDFLQGEPSVGDRVLVTGMSGDEGVFTAASVEKLK